MRPFPLLPTLGPPRPWEPCLAGRLVSVRPPGVGVGGINQGVAACPLSWSPPLLACRHRVIRDCEAWGVGPGRDGGQESRAQGLDEGEGPVGNGELDPVAGKRAAGCVQTPLGEAEAGGADGEEEVPPPWPPACSSEAAACISHPSPGLFPSKGLFGQLNSLLIYRTFHCILSVQQCSRSSFEVEEGVGVRNTIPGVEGTQRARRPRLLLGWTGGCAGLSVTPGSSPCLGPAPASVGGAVCCFAQVNHLRPNLIFIHSFTHSLLPCPLLLSTPWALVMSPAALVPVDTEGEARGLHLGAPCPMAEARWQVSERRAGSPRGQPPASWWWADFPLPRT